jgi:hypothetical protein
VKLWVRIAWRLGTLVYLLALAVTSADLLLALPHDWVRVVEFTFYTFALGLAAACVTRS